MSNRQRRKREKLRRHEPRERPDRLAFQLATGAGLTVGATLLMGGVAQAAPMTFTVGSLDDTTGVFDCTTPTNTECTLRQAIIDANNNSGADTIVFRSGLSGHINLAGSELEITDGLTIQGPGAALITVDAGYNSRVIYANTAYGNPVSISSLTLAHGSAYGGGAIRNHQGDLTISDAVITGSKTTGSGGAIYLNYGSLLVESTTLSGNSATLYGGGVYFYNSDDAGQSVIRNSTISGNTVNGDGGGVYDNDSATQGPILIQNSTVTGNHAGDSNSDNGGGVYDFSNPAVITVDSSTITGNSAFNDGGGVFSRFGNTVRNSIISGNSAGSAGPDIGSELGAPAIKTAFDLIGNPNGAAIDEMVPGSNIIGADPQLGALANNGGPTQTQLPANASPVVNKGSAFGLTTDQRGLTRPVAFPGVANSSAAGGDGSDIGAVELQLPTPTTPPPPAQHKKKCKKKKKKHKRAAQSAKKKKCKKKKKKK
jgi:hypothetical protein